VQRGNVLDTEEYSIGKFAESRMRGLLGLPALRNYPAYCKFQSSDWSCALVHNPDLLLAQPLPNIIADTPVRHHLPK
jgi:hypothetical protein